jgi:hypothetical protein
MTEEGMCPENIFRLSRNSLPILHRTSRPAILIPSQGLGCDSRVALPAADPPDNRKAFALFSPGFPVPADA